MSKIPELIVMLTHNDRTVKNAHEIFEKAKNSKAKFWGFKEEGLSLNEMKALFNYMKECGKTTVLEVVAYTKKECLHGAKIAAECGCDILMGTLFSDTVNDFCKENNIKYLPFVGKVKNRPSVLEGTADDIISEAKAYIEKGVFGFDLLGYRYTQNADDLIERFVSGVNSCVCVAGNINSYEKLDKIKKANPWAFTIGGAFFENRFGADFTEQINNVCNYIAPSGRESF